MATATALLLILWTISWITKDANSIKVDPHDNIKDEDEENDDDDEDHDDEEDSEEQEESQEKKQKPQNNANKNQAKLKPIVYQNVNLFREEKKKKEDDLFKDEETDALFKDDEATEELFKEGLAEEMFKEGEGEDLFKDDRQNQNKSNKEEDKLFEDVKAEELFKDELKEEELKGKKPEEILFNPDKPDEEYLPLSPEFAPNVYPFYSYRYNVYDPLTEDYKSQQETRNGGTVKGFYAVKDADGTLREVHYTADEKNGFRVIIRRNGGQLEYFPKNSAKT